MNYLIAGNWKMNASKQFIRSYLSNLNFEENINVKMLICPPDCYLNEVNSKTNLAISKGAQNISFEEDWAFTVEVSAKMLNDLNVEYTIVGHSERRTIFNETSNEVSIKATNSLKNNIHPIICVGETLQQKKDNQTKEILSKQFNESINDDTNNDNTIIAYEPIWAIGSGLTPSLDEINEIHNFIKNEIQGYENYKILYGGSVKSANSKEILNLDNVDGLLIGGSSLNVDEFKKILSF